MDLACLGLGADPRILLGVGDPSTPDERARRANQPPKPPLPRPRARVVRAGHRTPRSYAGRADLLSSPRPPTRRRTGWRLDPGAGSQCPSSPQRPFSALQCARGVAAWVGISGV